MDLQVDVDELHTAGAQVSLTSDRPGGLASAVVGAAAKDEVSAGIAATLTLRLQTIGAHSARAAHIAAMSAAVLHANANTYREQENLNAEALKDGNGSPPIAAPTTITPILQTPPAPAAPSPAGVTPTDGKAIAALIHGGQGTGPLLAAAEDARTHAAELREISAELRAASARLETSWQSPGGEAAASRLQALAAWYDSHAEHADAAARECDHQADAFRRTRAEVPRPETFTDLEQRLHAASAANAASGGKYAPVITQLQTELAATHTKAQVTYAGYGGRAATLSGDPPQAPPTTVRALDYPLGPPSPPGPSNPSQPRFPTGTEPTGLAPGAPSDVGTMLLPPPAAAAPPISDATRQWVADMSAALAARPPDDPIAVEARRMAYLALHQPKVCDGWEWTSSTGGLAVSALGTAVTVAGTPAGPADWALLGASLAGTGLAAENVLKCISQAAAAG